MLIVACINLSFFLVYIKILVELANIKPVLLLSINFCAAGTVLGHKPLYVLSEGQILVFSSV